MKIGGRGGGVEGERGWGSLFGRKGGGGFVWRGYGSVLLFDEIDLDEMKSSDCFVL